MTTTPSPSPIPQPLLSKSVLFLPVAYFLTIFSILLSPRLQSLLTYFHYIKPPFPPSLKQHRLLAHSRTIRSKNLHGWHILPSGPPFPASEEDYDKQLGAPNQTVVLFFHGTSGTRAFPRTRVSLVKLFSAHLSAHVVTFDYSGYAECSGRPSEAALAEDARVAYHWVTDKIHPTAKVVIYGMSLGSYPALSLAAHLSSTIGTHQPSCVVTDSALSTLLDAVMSHPAGLPFRLFPFSRSIYHRFLRERLDNLANVSSVKFPLLILHGVNDRMINVKQARLLYDAALHAGNEQVELVTFDDVGHNDIASAEEYLSILWRFVSRFVTDEEIG